MQGRGRKKQVSFLFKVHFQKPWWSAWCKIWAKRNSNCPFMWWPIVLQYEWLLFSSWCKYWWSEDQTAGWGKYPCGCNQVLEAPACNVFCCSFCCMDYFLCPRVELLLTHVQTLIFLFFFPGISIFSVTCVRNTEHKLRMSKSCWCLPYVDLSWDTFFLISLIHTTS